MPYNQGIIVCFMHCFLLTSAGMSLRGVKPSVPRESNLRREKYIMPFVKYIYEAPTDQTADYPSGCSPDSDEVNKPEIS